VLVTRGLEDRFVELVRRFVFDFYGQDPKASPDFARIVNSGHFDRLVGLLDSGTAAVGGEHDAATRYISPTVLRDVLPESPVMQEEIFGPILPVRTYNTISEAIDYVNAHDRPLGLYYFGHDRAEESEVLSRTISGGVTVNDVLFHNAMDDLPFGGTGPSGMGAYHGIEGFRTFSHARAVYRQPRFDVGKLSGFKPPYGAMAKRMLGMQLKK